MNRRIRPPLVAAASAIALATVLTVHRPSCFAVEPADAPELLPPAAEILTARRETRAPAEERAAEPAPTVTAEDARGVCRASGDLSCVLVHETPAGVVVWTRSFQPRRAHRTWSVVVRPEGGAWDETTGLAPDQPAPDGQATANGAPILE